MQLNESLNTVLDYEMYYDGGSFVKFNFSLEEIGINLWVIVEIFYKDSDKVEIDFDTIGPEKNLTHQRVASFSIFATITDILKTFVEERNIVFVQAHPNSDKKKDIYLKLLRRFGDGWNVTEEGIFVRARKDR